VRVNQRGRWRFGDDLRLGVYDHVAAVDEIDVPGDAQDTVGIKSAEICPNKNIGLRRCIVP
jgi:hypothetical protein